MDLRSRIEALSESKRRLLAQRAARAAAARSADLRLVAYVVGDADAPAPEALREALAGELPDYMQPSAFVALPALPLGPNGKVDRRALPDPDELAGARYVAPRTALEEVLAGLCAEVLQLEAVGAHDDFFDLGGNSLLVTQYVARIRENLDRALPLSAVFEAPTVAGLATSMLARPESRARIEKTAELLLELAERSDDDVADELARRRTAAGSPDAG